MKVLRHGLASDVSEEGTVVAELKPDRPSDRDRPIPLEQVSIIIPVLNEERSILSLLHSLQSFRGEGHELILVDGGSRDQTLVLARPLVDQVISGPRGRAVQMNSGAQRASGDVLWFLHADSGVSVIAIDALLSLLAEDDWCWGRFDVTLSGRHRLLRVVEFMMNRRSRFTGIATGDQGIFVRRQTFERIGGFPEIELMEDITISSRLKAIAPPCCLSDRILVSSRRWEQNGVLKTMLLMWRLRLAFFLGADPACLARRYAGEKCGSLTAGS